jgi:group II intron reverse transcriptase/maturase
MEILAKINKNSNKNKEETFTRLYRYLLRPDIYYTAYKNLYANNGAATRGVNDDTADGFSEDKIVKIIASLKDETYQPNTVRRTYIKKTNGKQRPLGIPTFTDKLVQEALRMVLEAVYEPVFLDCSHGFRPNKSCHTALASISREFSGIRWFIEGDLKSCFDNIDHAVLIGLISKKVKDARLIKLIYKFLKAGYMEDWQYCATYSGVPQGGVISPLLANICLHELDKFVMTTLKSEFDRPSERRYTLPYYALRNQLAQLKRRINRASGTERQQLIDKHKYTRSMLIKTPAKSQTDKKITYQRYADDFLLGINGSHEDCLWIKNRLSDFISSSLRMELNMEKTLITHSNQYVRFLGYDIRVRRDSKIKPIRGINRCTKRTLLSTVDLSVPFEDKIQKFIIDNGIAKIRNGILEPVHRPVLLNCTDLEIISIYNAELRGICNYYGLASDFYKLSYFGYLMEYSCLKTFANKYKCHVSGVLRKFREGKGRWGVFYDSKAGRRYMYFAKYSDGKKAKRPVDLMFNAAKAYGYTRTTFEGRLKAKSCELCGTTGSSRYELHHVNKVKNLKGKNPWERAMIAKRRKTLAVCWECHYKIHDRRVLVDRAAMESRILGNR